jgi:hypothetical protein
MIACRWVLLSIAALLLWCNQSEAAKLAPRNVGDGMFRMTLGAAQSGGTQSYFFDQTGSGNGFVTDFSLRAEVNYWIVSNNSSTNTTIRLHGKWTPNFVNDGLSGTTTPTDFNFNEDFLEILLLPNQVLTNQFTPYTLQAVTVMTTLTTNTVQVIGWN